MSRHDLTTAPRETSRPEAFDFAGVPAERPVSRLSCALAGLIVGAAAGAILGGIAFFHGSKDGLIIGLIAGPLAGLIFGRRFAALDSVAFGAVAGGALPVALCLIDGIRR